MSRLLLDLLFWCVVAFSAIFFAILLIGYPLAGIIVAWQDRKSPGNPALGLLAYVAVLIGAAIAFSPLLIPYYFGWTWLLLAIPLVAFFCWIGSELFQGVDV